LTKTVKRKSVRGPFQKISRDNTQPNPDTYPYLSDPLENVEMALPGFKAPENINFLRGWGARGVGAACLKAH